MEKPGNTPLRNYEGLGHFGYELVQVKDESHNPTGTYKDRRSAYIVERAVQGRVRHLVLISAKNAAYSLKKYAEEEQIEVTAVIDEGLSDESKGVLHDAKVRVIEANLQEKFLDSATLVRMTRKKKREKIWDVTNGFHAAFKSIVQELPEQEPSSIVLPKGSGEAMNGIFEATQEREWKTTVIGIGSFFNERLRTKFTIYPESKYTEGRGNMIIVSAGTRADEARAIRMAPPDSEIDAEDASKLAMGAILVMPQYVFGKRVILINSGKGEVIG